MLSTKVPCCVNCGEAGGGRPDVCAAQVRRGGWEKGGLTERPERLTVIRGREHGSAHERDVDVRLLFDVVRACEADRSWMR